VHRCYSRAAVRIPVTLYVLALAVRAVLALHFPDPAYPDSFYYVDVARALHDGRGFNVDFIWIFAEVGGRLPATPTLPIPSNAHWMPLASLVQVPFMAIFGENPLAAAAPFAIIGSLAAPLAWAIAREAGAGALVAVGAGVLTAIPAASTPFMAQPDNFSLYQPLVAAALWMTARGLKGSSTSFVLAGLLAGLATLARNDGVLVAAVIGLAFLWDRWRARRATLSPERGTSLVPVSAAVASGALFVLAVGPWLLRQLQVFGSFSPSAASGKVLFIRNIAEWNSITAPATLQYFLGQGLGPLLESRVLGLVAAIAIFSVLVGGVVLVPFMLIGAWVRRRSVDFGPFFAYSILLFAFSALVSAVHVPGGTFIHSAVALAPHAYILTLEGIVASVAWVAARRRAWNIQQASHVFAGAAVGFAVVTALGASLFVHAGWKAERAQRQQVAVALDQAGAPSTDRLMSIDAGGYRYYAGRGGVVLVNDPLPTIEDVAKAYDIRWLVLERDDAVPAVAPILDGTRPAWVGAPVLTIAGGVGGEAVAKPGTPAVAVSPVCTAPTDMRCTTTASALR
jgi:4-amino-4-deoxy-L-arabinose transferase-like glycosyltransferase